MKEQEAITLLKSMGYVVSPPPSKREMLGTLDAMFNWYVEEVLDTPRIREQYAAIKRLIEEHA